MKFLRFLRELTTDRRVIIGVGAALLVGGWGTTQYVHERLMTYPADQLSSPRSRAWHGPRHNRVKLRSVFFCGLVGMAAGAGLMGFGALRNTSTVPGR